MIARTNKIITGLVSSCLVLFVASAASSAGELCAGSTITKVVVHNDTDNMAFGITISGGTGPCVSGGSIYFPTTTNAHRDDGMRSLAIAAFLAGKHVRVYDYGSGTNCNAADYIRME